MSKSVKGQKEEFQFSLIYQKVKASMKMHILNSGSTNLNSKLKNSCGLHSSIFTVEQPFQRYWDKCNGRIWLHSTHTHNKDLSSLGGDFIHLIIWRPWVWSSPGAASFFTYKGRLPKKINLKIDIYEKVVIFGQATSANDGLIKKVGKRNLKGGPRRPAPSSFFKSSCHQHF